jgi:hypothetical protein
MEEQPQQQQQKQEPYKQQRVVLYPVLIGSRDERGTWRFGTLSMVFIQPDGKLRGLALRHLFPEHYLMGSLCYRCSRSPDDPEVIMPGPVLGKVVHDQDMFVTLEIEDWVRNEPFFRQCSGT